MTCPELGRCEETLKPNATRPCNVHPCTTWVVGSWGEVSGHRRERAAPLIQGFCTKRKEWWGGNPTLKTKLGAAAIKTSRGLMLPAQCGVGAAALQGVGMGPPHGSPPLPRADRAALLPQCTAPCGGGIQRRQVKCINTKTGLAEEDSSLCDHEPWPESTQKCNPQDCESSESGKRVVSHSPSACPES